MNSGLYSAPRYADGGLRPPFLRMDRGIYYGGPQARCRDVLEAGLGGFLGFLVGLARDGGRWAISGSHLNHFHITKFADA